MTGNFGFIHEKLEIKILILFVLRHLRGPADYDMLTELVLREDGISYFDFAECVAELVATEHVSLSENEYSLTIKGAQNGKVTEGSLPYSVRVNAEEYIKAYRSAKIRNAMIKTSRAPAPDGGTSVSLSLSDGVGDIMTMQLFAANEKQAKGLEKGFRKNAEEVYNALIWAILS